MIKLKDIIINEVLRNSGLRSEALDENKALELLKSGEYSEAISAYKNGRYFYRRLYDPNSEFLLTTPTNKERVSKDGSNFYTAMISTLPSWKHFPRRSFSVIFSVQEISSNSDYGDKIFYVFPKNGANIALMNEQDGWESFRYLKSKFNAGSIDSFQIKVKTILEKISTESGTSSKSDVREIMNVTVDNCETVLKKMDEQFSVDVIESIAPDISFTNEYTDVSSRIFKDILANYKGSWKDYFDELFNPEKNEITHSPISGIDFGKHNKFEAYTDSPCLLINYDRRVFLNKI